MTSDVPKCIADKKNLKVAMLFHKGTLIDAKEKQIMVIICTNVYACIQLVNG